MRSAAKNCKALRSGTNAEIIEKTLQFLRSLEPDGVQKVAGSNPVTPGFLFVVTRLTLLKVRFIQTESNVSGARGLV